MILKAPDKISIMVGGKAIGVAESAQLTFTDDTSQNAKNDLDPWQPRDTEQSFCIGGIVAREPSKAISDLARDLIGGKWDVMIQQKIGHMPRKLKKAMRSNYRRITKWKRKLAVHIYRSSIKIRAAEMVVTPEQQERLRAIIHGGTIEKGCNISFKTFKI